MTETTKKDRNRKRLIDAALEAIFEFGYAKASISEIIKIAGLSRGMVHLHFESKEALIAAAAKQASQDYYIGLEGFLNAADPSPQSKVEAIVNYDLSPQVLNLKNVCTWYELRGAARTHFEIAKYTGTRDAQLEGYYTKFFEQMSDDKRLVEDATKGTIALSEGIWIDFMLNPKKFDREAARRIVFRSLSGIISTWKF